MADPKTFAKRIMKTDPNLELFHDDKWRCFACITKFICQATLKIVAILTGGIGFVATLTDVFIP